MIRVTLGAFARSGVESYFGGDVLSGVQAAVVHYVRRLRAGRIPMRPPGFITGLGQTGSVFAVEMTVDAEDEAVFAAQARTCGTTVEQLALHAVLLYLAELEFFGVEPRHRTGGSVGCTG